MGKMTSSASFAIHGKSTYVYHIMTYIQVGYIYVAENKLHEQNTEYLPCINMVLTG